MDILVQIIFIICLIVNCRKNSYCLRMLIFIQAISFFMQFLVGHHSNYNTIWTLINSCFTVINLSLLFLPWNDSTENAFIIHNPRFIHNIKKILTLILSANLFINIILFIIILIFIPDIAHFKAAKGYEELYESIPYFSMFFRYSYVTQNMGFISFPLVFFYLNQKDKKNTKKWFILSLSSLASGLAFYSRAMILTYVLLFLTYYLCIYKSIDIKIRKELN